ncbi:MAG: hypothetical protein RLZZ336_1129 [Cyanobacteriota bacterium]|jgi:hypothetical protein
MTPLPDRVVIVAIVATIGLCFALVFWTVRLQPSEPPLRWRDGSTALQSEPMPMSAPASSSLSL